ncbi:unnamed protein product [Phytophthora fragariaefolia]|uniref:Unnamed protein product n=1 Tax=Phytophthora fragariaefolia TaxID=1490495 RepID=A0A9W7CM20_9STRA|nr:unnamed protein product [Phytophthora fragariaefolia]
MTTFNVKQNRRLAELLEQETDTAIIFRCCYSPGGDNEPNFSTEEATNFINRLFDEFRLRTRMIDSYTELHQDLSNFIRLPLKRPEHYHP